MNKKSIKIIERICFSLLLLSIVLSANNMEKSMEESNHRKLETLETITIKPIPDSWVHFPVGVYNVTYNNKIYEFNLTYSEICPISIPLSNITNMTNTTNDTNAPIPAIPLLTTGCYYWYNESNYYNKNPHYIAIRNQSDYQDYMDKNYLFQVCNHEICHTIYSNLPNNLDKEYWNETSQEMEGLCYTLQKNTTYPQCKMLFDLIGVKIE